MKKQIITWGLMFAATLALSVSCAKEQDVILDKDTTVAKSSKSFEIVAGTDATKTSAESLTSFAWVANDALSVFHTSVGGTSYPTNDKFTIAEEDLATNTFKGDLTGDLDDINDWYVFYPYGTYVSPSGAGYVSVGGNATQDYTKPMAHLAGSKFPLYGKITNLAKATKPSLTLKQAMSIAKIHVTNNSGSALDITSVTLSTEDYNIAGQFYINFEGTTPVFTAKEGSVGKSAVLTITNGTPLSNGSSYDYYISVVPFEAAAGKKIIVKVNDVQKEYTLASANSFKSGKFKTINFDYDVITPKATLPFAIDGTDGRAAYSSTDGLSSSGLGTDYASGNSPYLTKFDHTGDYIQIFFDKPADKVSFTVKKIGGKDNSKFYLSGSADGVSFTNIETFTIDGAQSAIKECTSTQAIDEAYRYLRLTFEKGANVGLGPFSVTTASTDPEILSSSIADVPAIGVNNAASTYTVKNFSDDVEVKEYTGCVTDAIAMDGDIVYSVGPNYTTAAAAGTIVLWSASNHEITKTINVAQLKSSLSVSSTEVIIPASANTATFTVTTPEFGYSAIVGSTEAGMNLSVSSGGSGSANNSAQTVTISSTTAAPTSGDPIVLGTISVYRNNNSSDSQKKTITIKKAVDSGVTASYKKVTSISEGNFLMVYDGKAASGTGSSLSVSAVTIDSNAIASDSSVDAYAITIASDGEGHYTLKMGTNYIGYSGSKTNLSENTSADSNNYKWTITMEEGTAYIVNVGTDTRFIGANSSSGFTQFKAYATSNKGTYPLPTLYKYTEE